jgi:hypothetical protein
MRDARGECVSDDDEGIPQEVRAFIADQIDSVLQLELLLLLHKKRDRDFGAAEVVAELRIDPTWAAAQLEDFCARGILTCAEAPSRRYRYAPKSPEIDGAITKLDQTYTDRRVSVISLIFSKPTDKLRSFADAFRVRKEKNDG